MPKCFIPDCFKNISPEKKVNFVAGFLLSVMFLLAVFSMKGDSLTMDEVSHLPAGYSYLTQKDMRINPEHPPLVKDLAAFPLLFIKGIKFPAQIAAWQEDINGQWAFGFDFMYHQGNPADKMIFWGRMPMIFVLILLGFYVFKWTKEIFGKKAGLLALFLYSFSPTLISHGRLITTDVAVSAGIFGALYYLVKFLKKPTKKNLIIAGIALGIAELTKFGAVLLLPIFFIIVFCWSLAKSFSPKSFLKTFLAYAGKLMLIIVIGYLFIYPIYQYHVWNYPVERQVRDTKYLLSSFSQQFRLLPDTVIWMADKPILRAYAQYGLGLLMVMQRASGGNTTYFMGEVSAAGWKNYFPIVYFIKEPLAFHLLTLISLGYVVYLAVKNKLTKPLIKNAFRDSSHWLEEHLAEFTMLVFIFIYWLSSVSSNLNIGVRHLLPVFPLTMVLVAGAVSKILNPPYLKIKYGLLALLLVWQAVTVIRIYPHFLAYFNKIAGGPDKAYAITVDSNLDWGQDLKRLKKWVDEKGIEKIYVDYFGGSEAQYYLKEKFIPWWGSRDSGELPQGSYLAVSATFLQGGRGKPVAGFNQPWGYYLWLNKYAPIAKIGYSIFVYRID